MSKPELFVEPDPELPLALLDQKEVMFLSSQRKCLIMIGSFVNIRTVRSQAGKKLLLITNSDYHYTDKMMKHSFNKFLPNDMDWRNLFDMVSKRKFVSAF